MFVLQYTVLSREILCIQYPADSTCLWSLLMKANKIRNPYNLRIGTELCIPGPAEDNKKKCAAVHIVKPGDTLYMIAKMHKVTLDAIMKANPDVDVYNLTVGTELCIPSC